MPALSASQLYCVSFCLYLFVCRAERDTAVYGLFFFSGTYVKCHLIIYVVWLSVNDGFIFETERSGYIVYVWVTKGMMKGQAGGEREGEKEERKKERGQRTTTIIININNSNDNNNNIIKNNNNFTNNKHLLAIM